MLIAHRVAHIVPTSHAGLGRGSVLVGRRR